MRKALLVGIDEYPDAALDSCVNDAKSLSEILEVHGNGKRNFDVRTETQVKKKSELKGLIKELFNDDNDVALFLFFWPWAFR